jgi:hypothetical protein
LDRAERQGFGQQHCGSLPQAAAPESLAGEALGDAAPAALSGMRVAL